MIQLKLFIKTDHWNLESSQPCHGTKAHGAATLSASNAAPLTAGARPKASRKAAAKAFIFHGGFGVQGQLVSVVRISPFISRLDRPFERGTARSLGDLRSPWLLTTYRSWDDPPSTNLFSPPFCRSVVGDSGCSTCWSPVIWLYFEQIWGTLQ